MQVSAIVSLGLVAWFMLLAGAEFVSARRRSSEETLNGDARLVTNFGLGAIVLFLNGLIPSAKFGAALLTPWLGGGIHSSLGLPWVSTFFVLIIADSCATYWTHRLMHAVPALWRIHRVHHSDSEVDVSTSLRNHPLELLVTVPVTVIVIFITGAPVTVVIAVQAIAVAAGIWQHADISFPRFERILSTIIITPSIHRIHHHPERSVHDNNFGELIVLWDRLFGTFRPGCKRGPVGLNGRVGRDNSLLKQIWSPIYSA